MVSENSSGEVTGRMSTHLSELPPAPPRPQPQTPAKSFINPSGGTAGRWGTEDEGSRVSAGEDE